MEIIDLCETCQEKEKCGCSSDEFAEGIDLEHIKDEYGITVVIAVTECRDYKKQT